MKVTSGASSSWKAAVSFACWAARHRSSSRRIVVSTPLLDGCCANSIEGIQSAMTVRHDLMGRKNRVLRLTTSVKESPPPQNHRWCSGQATYYSLNTNVKDENWRPSAQITVPVIDLASVVEPSNRAGPKSPQEKMSVTEG